MKLIIAVFPPAQLQNVQAALDMREACLISISQVASDVSDPGCLERDQGTAFPVGVPLLRLEIAVMDRYVERAVEALFRNGYTAASVQAGDVKIIVTPVEACLLAVSAEGGARSLKEWNVTTEGQVGEGHA
jgi:nitrogen regulatory protein PII